MSLLTMLAVTLTHPNTSVMSYLLCKAAAQHTTPQGAACSTDAPVIQSGFLPA